MLFDLYTPAPGWLQRLDPRAKMALGALGAAAFLAARGPLAVAALVAALHAALLASRVPGARLRWLVGQLRWVLLVMLLLFPWLAAEPGRTLAQLGPFAVTTGDLRLAAATALRLWGMSLLVMALLFTTAQAELVRGLVALGLPYEWGLTLALALRYIPSLSRQIEGIQEAQAARGWDAARGNVLKRLRGVGPVFVALTIHVFRTVDTLTMAMTARGVGRAAPRTVRQPLRFARRDWVAVGVGVGVTVAWVWGVRW